MVFVSFWRFGCMMTDACSHRGRGIEAAGWRRKRRQSTDQSYESDPDGMSKPLCIGIADAMSKAPRIGIADAMSKAPRTGIAEAMSKPRASASPTPCLDPMHRHH